MTVAPTCWLNVRTVLGLTGCQPSWLPERECTDAGAVRGAVDEARLRFSTLPRTDSSMLVGGDGASSSSPQPVTGGAGRTALSARARRSLALIGGSGEPALMNSSTLWWSVTRRMKADARLLRHELRLEARSLHRAEGDSVAATLSIGVHIQAVAVVVACAVSVRPLSSQTHKLGSA